MNLHDDELLRLLVKGARQEGREEVAGTSKYHNCREAEELIDQQGARVAELDEQLQTERYWHATWQEESQKLKECLERVQGERDALAAQLAESDRGHTEACDALCVSRRNLDNLHERAEGLERGTAEMQGTITDLRGELERVQAERDTESDADAVFGRFVGERYELPRGSC